MEEVDVKVIKSVVNDTLIDTRYLFSGFPGGGSECDTETLDIIAFSKEKLNIILWKRQKFILKVFYNLPLDKDEQEEIKWLYDNKGLKIPDNHETINFRELIIIAGRRGSKSVLASLIAVYEIYKLLCFSNPQSYYGLIPGTPISVLHCAAETKQARIVQDYIKGHIKSSDFFDKYLEHLSESEIRFKTEFDLQVGNSKGSIRIESLTSNSSSMPGRTAIMVILDEVARMMDTKGRLSGDQIYQALIPSILTFKEKGKIVSISSPLTKSGILYDLYLQSQEVDSMLCFQFSSWELNQELSKEDLKDEFEKNANWAKMEYGGDFGEVLDSAFDWDKIDAIVQPGTSIRKIGERERQYVICCDPATINDRYGLAWGHAELIGANKFIIIDGLKYFESKKILGADGEKKIEEVDLETVDQYVVDLIHSLRNVACIAYDQGKSTASIQKLKKMNYRAVETTFTNKYKSNLFHDMKQILNQGRLKVYENDPDNATALLIDEMKHLERQIKGDVLKIGHPMIGPVTTDDLYDCVSNLVHILLAENPKQIRRTIVTAPRIVRTRGLG